MREQLRDVFRRDVVKHYFRRWTEALGGARAAASAAAASETESSMAGRTGSEGTNTGRLAAPGSLSRSGSFMQTGPGGGARSSGSGEQLAAAGGGVGGGSAHRRSLVAGMSGSQVYLLGSSHSSAHAHAYVYARCTYSCTQAGTRAKTTCRPTKRSTFVILEITSCTILVLTAVEVEAKLQNEA